MDLQGISPSTSQEDGKKLSGSEVEVNGHDGVPVNTISLPMNESAIKSTKQRISDLFTIVAPPLCF